jgi:hypothetical protein
MSYWTNPKRKGSYGMAAAFERDAEEMRKLRAERDAALEQAAQLREAGAEFMRMLREESETRGRMFAENAALVCEVERLRALLRRVCEATLYLSPNDKALYHECKDAAGRGEGT